MVEDGGKGVMSIREAAKYLGISVRTLFSRTRAGLIDSYQDGRRRLFPMESLRKYIDLRLQEQRQVRESVNG